jgi:threonine/homoserine/homoserine lactone efflux protein
VLLFLSAFAMSIAFAAQPGVVTFETIRRGLAGGWRPAFLLELGSLVGDATWALIALTSAALLFQNPIIATILSLFGCVLLLKFAWEAWLASRQAVALEIGGAAVSVNHFAAGAALSLSNPANITFWLGMSGTIVGLGFLNPQPLDLLVFFTGFMSAQLLWCFFMAGLVTAGRRYITAQGFRWINLACALVLAYFGLTLLFNTVQTLLGGPG